ncbi:MAG: hypothetical protein ACRDRT_03890 [Pseudonocardiaceae bacterium]
MFEKEGTLLERTFRVLAPVFLSGWALAGCGGGESDNTEADSYVPRIDPAAFTTTVDNSYFPLAPGMRWVYEGPTDEGLERVLVEVTSSTRRVMGVDTVVVRDTASIDGKVVEDTYDWLAQDREGNVWYFGEDTKKFEDGGVSTAGSWEAGVDGAQPGIVMKAKPKVGDRYKQEYYKGDAEDTAEVLSVSERVSVPFGAFDAVIQTKDFTPLEPDVVENKFYAPGVGPILTTTVKGGKDRIELIEMTRP